MKSDVNEYKKVFVLMPYNSDLEVRLKTVAPNYEFIFRDRKTLTNEEADSAHIIMGNPRYHQIRGSRNLEWFQLTNAGTDEYTKDGSFPEHVKFTNMTGAFGRAISEHMLAMTLSAYKKLHIYRDNQRNSLWKDMGKERTVFGQTVLIIGVGDIGSEFAKLMKKFDAYNIGIRRVERVVPEFIDEMYQLSELDQLLPRADIVAICTPSTNATKHMIQKEQFGRMKEGSLLINVGRGDAVDTEALVEALESGSIMGAAIDVVYPEPLPEDHPLWKQENLIITPHISGLGYFHLEETYDKIVEVCLENLERYQESRKLLNEIDLKTGYRKL